MSYRLQSIEIGSPFDGFVAVVLGLVLAALIAPRRSGGPASATAQPDPVFTARLARRPDAERQAGLARPGSDHAGFCGRGQARAAAGPKSSN